VTDSLQDENAICTQLKRLFPVKTQHTASIDSILPMPYRPILHRSYTE